MRDFEKVLTVDTKHDGALTANAGLLIDLAIALRSAAKKEHTDGFDGFSKTFQTLAEDIDNVLEKNGYFKEVS